MKTHGGARSGAGRPRKDSPLGYLRMLEAQRSEGEMLRAGQGLIDFRWTRRLRREFLRSSRVDVAQIHSRVIDQIWEALLTGLPKMAEHGDMAQAWFALYVVN